MPDDLMLARRSALVALEGIDRAGKSTLLRGLPSVLQDCTVPIKSLAEFQSPIGPFLKESLRRLSPFEKTFFFAADRSWTYIEQCLPALRSGSLVLWDRYVDSALAYRAVDLGGTDEPVDLQFVRNINTPFQRPDLTIYVDVSVETSIRRSSTGQADEHTAPFLKAVRAQYLALAKGPGYVTLNGESVADEVLSAAATILRQNFPNIF